MFGFRKFGCSAAAVHESAPGLRQQSQQPETGLATPHGLNEATRNPKFDAPFGAMKFLWTDSRMSNVSDSGAASDTRATALAMVYMSPVSILPPAATAPANVTVTCGSQS